MDYLGKGDMLTNRDVKNMCTEFERIKLFCDIFEDLLFQLMKGPILYMLRLYFGSV